MPQEEDVAKGTGKAEAAPLEDKAKGKSKCPKDSHFATNCSGQKDDSRGNQQSQDAHTDIGRKGEDAGRYRGASRGCDVAAQRPNSFREMSV